MEDDWVADLSTDQKEPCWLIHKQDLANVDGVRKLIDTVICSHC